MCQLCRPQSQLKGSEVPWTATEWEKTIGKPTYCADRINHRGACSAKHNPQMHLCINTSDPHNPELHCNYWASNLSCTQHLTQTQVFHSNPGFFGVPTHTHLAWPSRSAQGRGPRSRSGGADLKAGKAGKTTWKMPKIMGYNENRDLPTKNWEFHGGFMGIQWFDGGLIGIIRDNDNSS